MYIYIYTYVCMYSYPPPNTGPSSREALQVVTRRMEDIDSQLMADTNEAKQASCAAVEPGVIVMV